MAEQAERVPAAGKLMGLIAAALAVWGAFALTDVVIPRLVAMSRDPDVALFWAIAFRIYAIVGIPAALLIMLGAGFPLWSIAEARGWANGRRAWQTGALAGATLAAAITLTVELAGLIDQTPGHVGHWGHMVSVNGLYTPFGWALEGLNVLKTSLVGALGGFTAWNVGRLRRSSPS